VLERRGGSRLCQGKVKPEELNIGWQGLCGRGNFRKKTPPPPPPPPPRTKKNQTNKKKKKKIFFFFFGFVWLFWFFGLGGLYLFFGGGGLLGLLGGGLFFLGLLLFFGVFGGCLVFFFVGFFCFFPTPPTTAQQPPQPPAPFLFLVFMFVFIMYWFGGGCVFFGVGEVGSFLVGGGYGGFRGGKREKAECTGEEVTLRVENDGGETGRGEEGPWGGKCLRSGRCARGR